MLHREIASRCSALHHPALFHPMRLFERGEVCTRKFFWQWDLSVQLCRLFRNCVLFVGVAVLFFPSRFPAVKSHFPSISWSSFPPSFVRIRELRRWVWQSFKNIPTWSRATRTFSTPEWRDFRGHYRKKIRKKSKKNRIIVKKHISRNFSIIIM